MPKYPLPPPPPEPPPLPPPPAPQKPAATAASAEAAEEAARERDALLAAKIKVVAQAQRAGTDTTKLPADAVPQSEAVEEEPAAQLWGGGTGDLALQGPCEADLERFCKEVEPGEGRLASCITHQLEEEEEGDDDGEAARQGRGGLTGAHDLSCLCPAAASATADAPVPCCSRCHLPPPPQATRCLASAGASSGRSAGTAPLTSTRTLAWPRWVGV